MEGEILLPLYLYRFIRLNFVTINLVVILDYTIIILGEQNMARGVKKTLQEKIAQKEELIDALSTRVKKEKEELNELLEMQKMEELNELRMAVQKSGMEISDIIQMAQMQAAQ